MDPKSVRTVEEFINNIAQTITLINESDSVEATLRSITLTTGQYTTLSFAMTGPWNDDVTRLRRAFSRYRSVVQGAEVRFVTPLPAHRYTHMTLGDVPLVPHARTNLSYGVRIDLTGQPGRTPPGLYLPTELVEAVRHESLARVKTIVDSGVDINVQAGNGHVVRMALRRANDGEHDVLDWLVKRSDLDWNGRIVHFEVVEPLIQYLLPSMSEHFGRLPWAQIDLHQESSDGDNVLHAYARHAITSVSVIRMILHHGSGTLALGINTEMKRPSELYYTASDDVSGMIKQTEIDTISTVTEWLLRCVTIPDIVALIAGYYTTFRLSLKRKLYPRGS
jgi:hypothetical protein